MRRIPVLLALASLLPPFLPPPSAEGADPPRFDERLTVLEVVLPVDVVLRDGTPVRDLRREHFEVREGKRELRILDFREIDLSAPPDPAATDHRVVPRAARRHLLLLFDLSYAGAPSLERALAGSRRLLESLRPEDLVGVATWGLSTGIRLHLSFTPDHAQASRMVDGMEAWLAGDSPTADGPRRSDPLRLLAPGAAVLAADLGSATGEETTIAAEMLDVANSGAGGGFLGETLADMDELTSARRRETRRSEVLELSRQLAGLAEATRELEGRKILVLFSEGFDGRLLTDEGGARTLRGVQGMAERFRSAGWTIQAVETATSGGAGSLFDGDGLQLIAADTGGTLLRLADGLGAELDRRTSVTYLLTVQVEDVVADGAVHPLEVRLRDVPRGARAVHRTGYVAPLPGERDPELHRALEAATLLLGAEESDDLGAGALVQPLGSPAGAETVRTGVWVALDGEKLLADRTAAGSLDVVGYALEDGRTDAIGDAFAIDLRLEPSPDLEDRLRTDGLHAYADLDLAPGPWALRLLVRDSSTGRRSLATVRFAVPEDAARSRLAPPLVLVDRPDRAVLVREEGSDDYPLLVGDRPVLPAPIAAGHTAGPPLRALVLGWNLDPEGRLGFDLRSADGGEAEAGALALRGRGDGPFGADAFYLEVDPSRLRAGAWILETEAVHPSGERATAATPLRIDGPRAEGEPPR